MVRFQDSPEEAAFREEVRQFIAERLPHELRGQLRMGTVGDMSPELEAAQARWNAALRERGWYAAHWPKQYGGAGLTIGEQFILNQEMALSRAPMPFNVSTSHAGPTIMLYGTEEQKARFLPKILSGEENWCQLFSEPGAGSDLASLQTRAVRSGDEYIINGQKIWSSGAHRADWGILLARTNPDAPKHRGISYFLLDMKSAGVSVRPLYSLAGTHHFNEVFFEDVHVPRTCLLGEENRGWYVATSTLDLERSNVATSVNQSLVAEDLAAIARDMAITTERPALRLELAERRIEAEVGQLLSYVVVSEQKKGRIPNREASVAKLYASELEQRMAGTAVKMAGLAGTLIEGPSAPADGAFSRAYLNAVAITIGGGTSEIMRNIIATRGLGLPRA